MLRTRGHGLDGGQGVRDGRREEGRADLFQGWRKGKGVIRWVEKERSGLAVGREAGLAGFRDGGRGKGLIG
jgi:hypothetical protein